jgi:hypothetical protein
MRIPSGDPRAIRVSLPQGNLTTLPCVDLLSDSNVALANPCTFGAGKFFRWARNLSVGGREETTACGSRYHDTPT